MLWKHDKLPERVAFLRALKKNLSPYYVVCQHCGQLHIGSKKRHEQTLEWDHHFSKKPACVTDDEERRVHYWLHNGFRFITFQAAMKLHRHGLDCSEQLVCLSGCETRYWLDIGYIYQRVATPRIVLNQLLIRVQFWFWFSAEERLSSSRILIPDLCPHSRYIPSASVHLEDAAQGATTEARWTVRDFFAELLNYTRSVPYLHLFACLVCLTKS